MTISSEYTETIKAALEKFVSQGLPAATAERAHECASKMFKLVAEYEEGGLIALGIVGATVDSLIQE